jgi:methyl-accepting chemotaxis protein
MRLRSQLLLVALCASILFGLVGALILSRTLQAATDPLLERGVGTAERAVLQRWRSDRKHRRLAYESVAERAYLRAFLMAGDHDQLSTFAHSVQKLGADFVALQNRQGEVLAISANNALDSADAGRVAQRASQEALGPDGELLAIGDALWEVFRVPVGHDLWAGHLVAAYRVSSASLAALVDGTNIDLTLVVGETALSTLPAATLAKPRALADPWSQETRFISERYRLRTALFGRGSLIVAVAQGSTSGWALDLWRQLGIILVLVLLATLTVVFAGIERITRPIEQLKDAAEQLGRGQLLRTRSLLQDLGNRKDEIGTLAGAFNVAAQRLNSFVGSSMRVVRHLSAAVGVVERSSNSLAAGAAKQEERLNEVSSTMAPLLKSLEQTTLALGDARTSAISLSLVSNATDQAMALLTTSIRRTEALLNSTEGGSSEGRGTLRTASLLQQVAQVSKLNTDLRDALIRVRDQVAAIKLRLDEASEIHVREQHQSEHIGRAMAELDRLAKQHAGEAIALRGSSEQLRRDMEHLTKLLSAMEAQGPLEIDETAAASSGYYRPIRVEPKTSGEQISLPPSRRSRREISRDELAGLGRGSGTSPRSTTSSKPEMQPIRLPTPGQKSPPSSQSKD